MQFVAQVEGGCVLIERDDVVVPEYEIGQRVVYKRTDIDVDVEGDITAHFVSSRVKDGEYIQEVYYELDNGDNVYEDEIEKFYEVED